MTEDDSLPRSALPSPIRAVTLELTQARIDGFDAQATVEFVAERGFNTVVCFAIGYGGGEAYYPSALAPEHADLRGRDLFGDVCAAAHERGLAVVAYVNALFGGPRFFEPHPDWTQRWADGRESTQIAARMLCPNSPYGDHIVAVAAEIAQRYPIDGFYLDEPSLQSWCACDFCRARYAAETGEALPLAIERGAAAFARFLSWRESVITRFIESVADAVRAARPQAAFFAQHAFPLASTAQPHLRRLYWGEDSGRTPPQWQGWYRPSFYGQNIAQVAPTLDLIGIEPWRRFVAQPAWWPGACVSYALSAGGGKPVLPLMEYPHFPWGLGRLSDSELEVNCADVAANGGDLWFPMYAPDAADRAGWDTLHAIFGRLDGARPNDARQIAPVGILSSRRSAERFGANDVEDRYLDDLMGMVQLARELGLPYRVLSEDTLDANVLLETSLLLLPSAACLDGATASSIQDWVREGGSLITTGWTGTHDETGAMRQVPLLTDLLGVSLGPDSLHTGLGYLVPRADSGLPAERRIPVRDEQPVVHVTHAEPLYDVLPSWDLFAPPAETATSVSITRHRYGKGTAVYCGIAIGRLRRRFELFEAREILQLLLAAADGPVLPVVGHHLAPEVGLHCWQAGNEIRVFLVNMTSLEMSGQAASLGPQSLRLAQTMAPRMLKASSHRGAATTISAVGDFWLVEVEHLDEWDCLVLTIDRRTE